MSDKKISQLTAATTPLAGTETLPIVQGGQTVKASAQSIANLAPAELPSQTGNNGKYLTTNGSTASWGTVTGGQNYKTIALIFSLSGGSYSGTVLYNDTGATLFYSLSSNNLIISSGASPVFTTNKTFATCGNLLLSTPSIAVMGNVICNTTFIQFGFYTTAGAPQNLTVATTSPQTILIQVYP
jgi:hypothetical protein